MSGCYWLKIPKFSQHNPLILRWENLGYFSQSQQRFFWCELENIAIEQSFVAVSRERRR
jgi:hypothetical protein